MELKNILSDAVKYQASDIFIVVGRPVSFKIKGVIIQQYSYSLKPVDSQALVEEMYALSEGRDSDYRKSGDDDFAISLAGVGRFRVNIYKQRGTWSAVLRVVSFLMTDLKEMGIPQSVIELGNLTKGLVLITGTAGSGKSTTMTYIIDHINKSRNCHILTLEDPIEYLHKHRNSIVSQREIGIDSPSYSNALRAAMRESPDVIFIGEMRDYETIEIAMTAAETGHLVLSTLHTIGAVNTIDRIIDVFPSNQQLQIRFQLSMVLKAIVSQQLLRGHDGLVPAFEMLEANNAVRTMIRDGKVHQIDSVILSTAQDNMKSMDQSILELYQANKIDADTALTYCTNIELMKRNIVM